jgi:TPR repeat protein
VELRAQGRLRPRRASVHRDHHQPDPIGNAHHQRHLDAAEHATGPSEAPAAVSNSSGGLSPAEHAAQGRQFMESGDFAQARQHLEQAVQGGDAGAACHLGEMTLKGQGGIKADQDAAAKLFQLAQSRNTICFAPGQ